MARRRQPAQPAPQPAPPPPEVTADAPPALVLPDRPPLPPPVVAEPPPPPTVAEPAPPPLRPATPPQPAAETVVPPPAATAPSLLQDPALVLILLGVTVALTAFGALFALLAWRRSAVSADVTRAAAEFTRSSVTILANEARHTDRSLRDETARMREEADQRGVSLRSEVREQIGTVGDRLNSGLQGSRLAVETRMDHFAATQADASERLRFEVGRSVASFAEGLKADMTSFQGATRDALAGVEHRIAALTEANEQRQNALRLAVEERLEALRASNDARLEQMRATVEEKLQGTLEKRLGESFALVSERLENVQRGLGEMQALATGVGDLKRVLTNVKTRGGWAEIQLGSLLGSILSPDQFAANVEVRPGSGERVEFSVLLPGDGDRAMHLPIDAKFPLEDYERLVRAQEDNDLVASDSSARGVEAAIRREAARISSKYIVPPDSTDYAFLYLPSEGLYAEVARRPGLMADIQAAHRVVIAGPSTLAAMLNALQMGFRALAIQQRSGEVWRVLGEAKAEFEKYGQVWDRLKKQLETAQNTVEDAGRRTRAVTRKLRNVEALDTPGTPALLTTDDAEEPDPA